MKNPQPPRFEITRTEIGRVVEEFYASVRAHGMLGPVFEVHVKDWPAHEAQETGFWAGMILHEPGSKPNLMMAHVEAGNVRPGMFSAWLKLFDDTLSQELRPEQAEAWSLLAHNIGKSLRAGVVDKETLPGGVPKLF
ncbi:MAG: group III truncated hemoglobin [Pseudomonadota bacterium]